MPQSRLLTVLGVLAFAASPVAAQFKLNAYPVTFSYDPLSPEVVMGTHSAGSLQTCNAPFLDPTEATVYSAAALGIPPGGNLDALSDGVDYFTSPGIISPPPTTCPPPFVPVPGWTCRVEFVEFTVDRLTVGLATGSSTVVNAEATTDGAASDTFGFTIVAVAPVPVMTTVTLVSDGICGTPKACPGCAESDLDALSWRPRAGPAHVFFSVDPPTALAMGVSPADVLAVGGTFGSTPVVFRSQASLGLVPGDDVDALAVNGTGHILFSLSRASPTAQSPLWAEVNAAGLFMALAAPPPGACPFFIWAKAAQLGLQSNPPAGGPPPDDLNGVRTFDPGASSLREGAVPDAGGQTVDILTIDGDPGNVIRRVWVPASQPAIVRLAAPPLATGPVDYALFCRLGDACDGDGLCFPPPTGCLAFPPFFSPLAHALIASAALAPVVPVLLPSPPPPVAITIPTGSYVAWSPILFQAVVIEGLASGGPLSIRTSNLVALAVDP